MPNETKLSELNIALSQKASLLNLPEDVFLHMCQFVPAFQFSGSNPIQSVHPDWNKACFKPSLNKKKSQSSLLHSCHDADDALFILSDEELMNQLSLQEILIVAGFHPQLSHFVSSTPDVANRLNEDDLKELESHRYDKVVATPVATNRNAELPECYQLYSGFTLVKIGRTNVNTAMQILKSPALREKLFNAIDAYELTWLAGKFYETAEFVLNDKELCQRLKDHELVRMVETFPMLTQKLINDPVLSKMLSPKDFARLASWDIKMANDLLDNEQLCSQLESFDLAMLGNKHGVIAKRILTTPSLLSRLKGFDIGSLGITYAVAYHIYTTPELNQRLGREGWLELARNNNQLAKQIIPTLYSNIPDKNLCRDVGLKNVEAAQQILNLPGIEERLLGDQRPLLNDLRKYIFVAQRIHAKAKEIAQEKKTASMTNKRKIG